MSKTGIWILSIIGGLIVLFAAFKMFGSKDGDLLKVAVEKSEKRTIVESVPGGTERS